MVFLYFFLGLFLGALLVFLWTRSQVATTAQKLSADLAVAEKASWKQHRRMLTDSRKCRA